MLTHALSTVAGCIRYLQSLADFLSQHRVPTVLLAEAPTAAAAAAVGAQLQPHCRAPEVRLSLIQPLNASASFAAAISLLNIPLDHVAAIQLGGGGAAVSPAAALSPLRLDPSSDPPALLSDTLSYIASKIKSSTGALCVGAAMKRSRQVALTGQGMLPFLPIDGVFFLPLDPYNLPSTNNTELSTLVDVLLHKPSDFLAEPADGSGEVPPLRSEALSLLQSLPSAIVIDPLESMAPVLDRFNMAEALEAACRAARKAALPVRAPAWHLIESFSPHSLRAARSAGVSLPCVVKPRVACGPDVAHAMAFILHPSGLHPDLDVPLPALLQEYVDHQATVWKVYVAGEQVFTAAKRSTPDLGPLKDLLEGDEEGEREELTDGIDGNEDEEEFDVPPSIEFHSLQSLPVSLPWARAVAADAAPGASNPQTPIVGVEIPQEATFSPEPESPAPLAGPLPFSSAVMRPEFFNRMAEVLRRQLGLTLFGFDVVFDYSAGEAVVLDVNFFPSFRGIEEAPAALRAALRQRWCEAHKTDSKT